MVAFGAAVDEQRFHRDAGSLLATRWHASKHADGDACLSSALVANTYTAACFSENAGLSLLSGLLPPAIMLMQTGFLLSPDPDARQDGTGNGYENLVPLAGEIRSGNTILPAILPAGSGTACRTMSEINR